MNLPAFHDNQSEFGQFVQDAREVLLGQVETGGDDPLVGRQGYCNIDPVMFAFGELAQQIADDALLAGMQRIRLDVGHQLVQAHGHAGQHLAAEHRVARQFLENHGLGNVQQQRVAERLGEDDVGLVHEHDRFAEALTLVDDLDDLLVALRRREGELDLAVDQQVKAGAWIALVEQDVALGGLAFAGRSGDAGDFLGREAIEQRQVGEQCFGVDAWSGGHDSPGKNDV